MPSEKTRTAIIVGVLAVVVILVFGGLTLFILKIRAVAAQKQALEELKQDNPVEYYVLHTPAAANDDDLRNEMVGTWYLVGTKSRSTGIFITLISPQNYHKTFTLTNWAIATYDNNSNLLYSAGGRYTLQGDLYTESIEEATGQMTQYLGAHPRFRIRVVGDKYYQMGAGRNPSIEEMWQRADE
ncbi:MAG TPA: hypothetical protein VMB22_05340 [Verrucomicrobiae bacterium]|nr:hypothetical protein [Verrucomicrobiae bacterium]